MIRKTISISLLFQAGSIAMTLCPTNLYGQEPSTKLIDSIEHSVFKTLVNHGQLLESDKLNSFHVLEIVERTPLTVQSSGLYTISVSTSHSKTLVMIKDGSNFKTYDPDSLRLLLTDATLLFSKLNYPSTRVAEYTNAVLGVFWANTKRKPVKRKP